MACDKLTFLEFLQSFRWRSNSGVLQIGFVWPRVECPHRAYFTQIATRAAEETACPVNFGRAPDG